MLILRDLIIIICKIIYKQYNFDFDGVFRLQRSRFRCWIFQIWRAIQHPTQSGKNRLGSSMRFYYLKICVYITFGLLSQEIPFPAFRPHKLTCLLQGSILIPLKSHTDVHFFVCRNIFLCDKVTSKFVSLTSLAKALNSSGCGMLYSGVSNVTLNLSRCSVIEDIRDERKSCKKKSFRLNLIKLN